MVTGAVWPHAQPPAATPAAHEADPSPASMRFDFTATLRRLLEGLLSGVLTRATQ
ncbi:hypothetical protein [Streptomyces yanii]|uniref:Tetracyclin repressor-like C-terminal domain-containing protein n=1 Tax=Streptomyces yanii TaxID=78510 RepID=A0ABV5RGY7_9ACTN